MIYSGCPSTLVWVIVIKAYAATGKEEVIPGCRAFIASFVIKKNGGLFNVSI
jgi:hypothetical protein